MHKSSEILNRFYKDCGIELFKLRAENKLSLIKLRERGECREPWTICKLSAFYGKTIKIELTN